MALGLAHKEEVWIWDMIIFYSGAEKGGLGELVYKCLARQNVMMSFTDLSSGDDRFLKLYGKRKERQDVGAEQEKE